MSFGTFEIIQSVICSWVDGGVHTPMCPFCVHDLFPIVILSASLEIMTCTPEISGVDFDFHLAYWR